MIYTDLTKKALRIAFDAHKEQVDKTGLPYIFHPFYLAEQMTDEVSTCAALLHDVAEDTDVTLNDLVMQGFPAKVIDIIKLLTHDNAVPYMDYIRRIKNSGNQAAISVKLADLRHNLDVSRIDAFDENTFSRLAKYREASEFLERYGAKNVFIEKEVGTGIVVYKLRVGETVFYVSDNFAPLPRAFSDPISTYDLINSKTFVTLKNPAYEHITIVPGLKLEFPVYEERNPNPIAKIEIVYGNDPFSSTHRYYIINSNEEKSLGINFVDNNARDSRYDIAVSVYLDRSFEYDSRSVVEERYIVNIDDEHHQWLHHIFHVFVM